jgi:hypothetical protein
VVAAFRKNPFHVVGRCCDRRVGCSVLKRNVWLRETLYKIRLCVIFYGKTKLLLVIMARLRVAISVGFSDG